MRVSFRSVLCTLFLSILASCVIYIYIYINIYTAGNADTFDGFGEGWSPAGSCEYWADVQLAMKYHGTLRVSIHNDSLFFYRGDVKVNLWTEGARLHVQQQKEKGQLK